MEPRAGCLVVADSPARPAVVKRWLPQEVPGAWEAACRVALSAVRQGRAVGSAAASAAGHQAPRSAALAVAAGWAALRAVAAASGDRRPSGEETRRSCRA